MFLQQQLKALSLAGPEAQACGWLNILLPVKAIYNVPVPGPLSAVSNLHLREHFGAMDGWLADSAPTLLVLHMQTWGCDQKSESRWHAYGVANSFFFFFYRTPLDATNGWACCEGGVKWPSLLAHMCILCMCLCE